MKHAIKLRLHETANVRPRGPFAFDATFHKPDHFPSRASHWEPGIHWQTWNWQGKRLGIEFVDRGTVAEPTVEIRIYAAEKPPAGFVESLVEEIKYRYNLDLDLSEFYTTFGQDGILAPILRRWCGMRPGHPNSLYEYLIIGIVLQNAAVYRSVQMLSALLENYGTPLEFGGKTLWCFWSPGELRRVSEDELRGLRVGYRAKSIKRIDDCFSRGLLDEDELRTRDRDSQKAELLKLYGVGPATASYLLFDVFRHYDSFDHISPWEQKIYSKLFFDRSPDDPVAISELLKHFERYGRYKQLAVHYIWEDLFWRRQHEDIPWLEREIRL